MNCRWMNPVIVLVALLFCVACGTKTTQPSKAIASQDNLIYWEEYGKGEQTLVLIHGWSNTLHVWDEQVKRLSSSYRVVAVDLPGFGKSQNVHGSWTMDWFGRKVAEVIRSLDLSNVILVGFSMGGPVSIETAKQVPDKVTGVVLVDVLQNPEYRYSEAYIQSFASTYMDTVTYPTLDKVKPFFRTHQDELSKRYMAMIRDVPKTGWKESLENCMRWMNDEATASIQTLQAPIFSINSDQYPTEAALFRKYSPLYKVRTIQGVNHVVFWEAPGMFVEYLRECIHDLQILSQNP